MMQNTLHQDFIKTVCTLHLICIKRLRSSASLCESNEKSCFPISDQVDDLDECVSKLVELLGERGVSSYTTSWIYVWILLISVAMQVRTTRHTALPLTMMVI
jgi:hypothetical protein